MTTPSGSRSSEPPPARRKAWWIAGLTLVAAVVLIIGFAYVPAAQDGMESSARRSSASPSSSLPMSPAQPDAATGSGTSSSDAVRATPTAAAQLVTPSKSAEQEPGTTARPGKQVTPTEVPDEVSHQVDGDAELATVEQPVSKAVELEEPAEVTDGITATVSSLKAIQAEAFGIGEIAGPALRFVVTVENTTGNAVDLSNSVVTVQYGPDELPAVQLTGSGAKPFEGSAPPDESVSATMVFAVPADQRDQTTILLSIEASSPIAAFHGPAPVDEG